MALVMLVMSKLHELCGDWGDLNPLLMAHLLADSLEILAVASAPLPVEPCQPLVFVGIFLNQSDPWPKLIPCLTPWRNYFEI
jgi:hypothetical protein